jgi:hypothetical protein
MPFYECSGMSYALLQIYALLLSTNMVDSQLYALQESMPYEGYALGGSRL